jgi:hypothetical protein
MHQIAKINHFETSILGGNGIAVKLADTVAKGNLSRAAGHSAGFQLSLKPAAPRELSNENLPMAHGHGFRSRASP